MLGLFVEKMLEVGGKCRLRGALDEVVQKVTGMDAMQGTQPIFPMLVEDDPISTPHVEMKTIPFSVILSTPLPSVSTSVTFWRLNVGK
jgi:hypothetical protein